MAKITRKLQKIFAGDAINNGQFGSAQASTFVTSDDPDVIQGLSAFTDGWDSAIVGGTRSPAKEEMQGLHYLTTRQIAYLLQEGVAEYNSDTEYHQYSIVKKTGTYEVYGSLTNTNTGNALPSKTDSTYWQYLGDLAELKNIGASTVPVGSISAFVTESAVPSDWLVLDGSTFDQATYPLLYSALGNTNVLPDMRGEFMRGADLGRGVDSGRTVGSTQSDAIRNITGTQLGLAWRTSAVGTGSSGAFTSTTTGGLGANTFDAPNTAKIGFDASKVVPTASENRPRNVAFVYAVKAE